MSKITREQAIRELKEVIESEKNPVRPYLGRQSILTNLDLVLIYLNQQPQLSNDVEELFDAFYNECEDIKGHQEMFNIVIDIKQAFQALETKLSNEQPQESPNRLEPLSKDVEEAIVELEELNLKGLHKVVVGKGFMLVPLEDYLCTIKQKLQAQASKIEELRELNKGKAKEYFKLLEMYNTLDAKLYAIRKVVNNIREHMQLNLDYHSYEYQAIDKIHQLLKE